MTPTINTIKGALYTALWTFLAALFLLSTGWLASLAGWASSSGHAALPGLSTIGYAVVGAAVSAVSGLISFAVRFAQTKVPALPGNVPVYVPPVPPGVAVDGVPAAGGIAGQVAATIARRDAAQADVDALANAVQAALNPPAPPAPAAPPTT